MSGKMSARPVWAGVAVRMDDGTLYAFEVTEKIQATVEVEKHFRERPTDSPFVEYEPTGASSVDIRVTGMARNWARWADPQREQPGIDPAIREIEGTKESDGEG